MGLGELAVRELHVLKMGEMRHAGVLTVGHVGGDVRNDGVFQRHGEIMFHGALGRGAVEFELHLGQALAAGKSAVEQGRTLVHDLGDLQGLVHALARGLAGLRVAGQQDLVLEGLDKGLVFVPFLIDVAHRGFGKVVGGDVALTLAGNGHIRWGRHNDLLLLVKV